MIHCLAPLTPQQFLSQYWQQRARVFRQSMPDMIDVVSGDDLAGLACDEDSESRIITGYDHHGQWSCEQGPFSEQTFAQLGEKNWTLLVQGVDQYSEDIYQLLSRFDFLPRWRLEDIMASYAPLGGGVGPHFDYYDVFLIQISGSRQWKLGQQCDDQTPLQNNSQVKLLQQFVTEDSHELHPGDMLYIPAGQAHWGTAMTDDCITFSVGFRAPSQKELLNATVEYVIDHAAQQQRYRDTAKSIDTHPGKINVHTVSVLEELAEVSPAVWQEALQKAFGELVTEPRYGGWADEDITSMSKEAIQGHIEQQGELVFDVPASTRIAFSDKALYVNGESYAVDEAFSKQFYQQRIPSSSVNDVTLDILFTLFERGDILL